MHKTIYTNEMRFLINQILDLRDECLDNGVVYFDDIQNLLDNWDEYRAGKQ